MQGLFVSRSDLYAISECAAEAAPNQQHLFVKLAVHVTTHESFMSHEIVGKLDQAGRLSRLHQLLSLQSDAHAIPAPSEPAKQQIN